MAKPKLIRLPLETEWATAAGGEEPKERYPWNRKGETSKTEDVIQRANVSESGINRTTPVWMYPQGESPHHVMDMSGNLWEWQANYRDKDHNFPSLRGGSWDYGGELARVSVRDSYHPLNRDFNFGFRVALLPSGRS